MIKQGQGDLIVSQDKFNEIFGENAPLIRGLMAERDLFKKETVQLAKDALDLQATVQRLEREHADFRQRAQLDLQDAQDKVFSLERENEGLKKFVKNIHDNYDCDTDQHKYQDGNGCRCCDAKKLSTYGIEGE